MERLRVSLLGKFHMQLGDRVLTSLSTAKLRDLFCYLLLYRERPHLREKLANLLWDESATTNPQRCLRKTLSYLRTALDSEVPALSDTLLLVEPEWVQVHPEANLWLDIVTIEQAFAMVRDVPGRVMAQQVADNLRDVVGLYRGDLLEGVYYDWCIYERERFQHMYLVLLSKLVEYCEAHRDYKAGVIYGTKILYYDRAHERTHRQLMRLLYLDNNRTAALRQYERCAEALDKELGVRPTKRTMAIYQQIRSDQLDVTTTLVPPTISKPTEAATSLLPEVLGRLQQLQTVLVEMQSQVHQEMQTVDCLISGNC